MYTTTWQVRRQITEIYCHDSSKFCKVDSHRNGNGPSQCGARTREIYKNKCKKKKKERNVELFFVFLSVFGQIRPDTTVGRKTPKLTTYLKQTTTS